MVQPVLVLGLALLFGAGAESPVAVGAAAGGSAPEVEGPSTFEGRESRRRPRKREFREHRVLPVPMLQFQPATGLVLGVRLRYVNRLPDRRINRVQLDAMLSMSTLLIQRHELRLQTRDLFRRQEIFSFRLLYYDDPVFPFFGYGRDETLDRVEVFDDRYRTSARVWGPDVNYQQPFEVLAPSRWDQPTTAYLRWFVGARFQVDRFDPDPNSVVAETHPDLDEGDVARRGSLYSGLSWDSRDKPWSPSWGALHDASIELAGPWLGGTEIWGRVNLSTRFYRPLVTRQVIFAGQLLLDGMVGDVPIVAQGLFGGLDPVEGVGGIRTGRGYYRRRFVGKAKAFGSIELRFEPRELRIGRFTATPAFKTFVDLGKVFQADQPLWQAWHPSGGAGVYVIWDRFYVYRVDVGLSPEGWAVLVGASHAF